MDLFFVTETWLSSGEKTKADELAPSGYIVEPFPRPAGAPGGGIAVVYRSSLKVTIKDRFDFDHSSFQLAQVTVTLQHTALHFFLLYRPPPTNRNKLKNSMFIDQLPNFLSYVNTLHGHVCFVGDANVHFDKPKEPFTKQTNECLELFNLKQLVKVPTHDRGHTLDWVVMIENGNILQSLTVSDSLKSDHLCVIMSFDVTPLSTSPVSRIVRNIRSIDRCSFKKDLTSEISASPSPTADNADAYVTSLRAVLDKHAPTAKRTVRDRSSSPWFCVLGNDLLNAKRARRSAERRWRDTGLTIFNDLYIKAKHTVSRLVDKAKRIYFNGKIEQAKSTKELFKLTNKLMTHSEPNKLPTMYPVIKLPSLFSTYFQEKIVKIRVELDAMQVTCQLPPPPPFTASSFVSFCPVTETEVKQCILKSAPKTCELDSIPTPLLIECLDVLLPSITAIINSSFHTGKFPEAFKRAQVTPILKKPNLDVNEMKNYRPVSNLSFISKIIEKLALIQLSTFLTSNNLLNPLQSAYRPGHSTETALLKIVNDLLLSLDSQNVSLLTMLDLSAAFDTIDHEVLLHRLRNDFGIHGSALSWFESYITTRTQYIAVNGHRSEPTTISFGVPQGSVLGPILFVLYTTPLADIISRHSILHHSYADDSQLQKSASPEKIPDLINDMQSCISDVKSWMTINKLKLNDDKTEVMILSSPHMRHKLKIPDNMTIGNASIPFSKTVKNLGFTLDNHLEMTAQVRDVARTANFQLRRISSIRRYLTPEATATLVLSFILSRLDYCNSLLYGCHDYLRERLQIIMNNAARMVLRIPRRAHITPHLINLHWLPVKQRIDYKIASLCYQCSFSPSAPLYLKQLVPIKEKSKHNTRSSSDTSVLRPAPANSKKTQGDKAFSRAGPTVWNDIPATIRSSESLPSFKSTLKTHLFNQAYE